MAYRINIESSTMKNKKYRDVIYTDNRIQIVLMSLEAGEDIPVEKHIGSQFIRVEKGRGVVKWGKTKGCLNEKILLTPGTAVIIPSNVWHYISASKKVAPLKIYSIYSPREHEHGLQQLSQPNKE